MRKRTIVIFAGLSAVLSVLLVACNSKGRNSEASAAEVPSAAVVAVKRGDITRYLNLAGQFQPYQVVDVHAKVSGYIRHIYVDIGDKVRAGQLLAVLEVPELDAQLKGTTSELARSRDEITQAQHNVARAEAEYSALHANYIRLQQAAAAQPGLIAEQELDDVRSKDMASAAQLDAAKAALSASRQQSDVANADNERVSALNNYTKVIAPLDGVIIWRYADTGALIQAGTSSDVQSLPVVKLSQSSLLRLRLPVPEDAVQYIHEGEEITVHVDAVNRSMTGKIVRFTRDVSLTTRTMETEIDVENKDLTLDPGMYANTTLQLQRESSVLTIPAQAVIHNGNRLSALVVDSQNRVQVRNITLGLEAAELVEVKSGLNEGDRVIVGGQSKYQPGEVVKPQLQQTPSGDTEVEPREGEQ